MEMVLPYLYPYPASGNEAVFAKARPAGENVKP
jgi:hypothetical protein